MKILIISDVHSNYEALLAVVHAEQADGIFCLGDLVDFGPQPAECVQWVRHHVRHCVRGNHDHAMAFDVSCRSSEKFRELSEASRAMNRELLLPEQIEYLQQLPVTKKLTFDDFRFHLSHAAPNGDLYKSDLQPNISDDALAAEIKDIDADFILCGHTHLPMVREIEGRTFINPGSVGLPLDGDPRASYAIFHNGKIKLRRMKYNVGKTVENLCESTLSPALAARLAEILHAGCDAVVATPGK
jgi:putative phosphoesterase